MAEESSDDILRTSFHNFQSGFQSVVCKVVGQVMLNLLRKDVIEKTWDAHTSKLFNIYAAAERFLNSVLPSSLFMAPISTFARLETDTEMEEKLYSTAFRLRRP